MIYATCTNACINIDIYLLLFTQLALQKRVSTRGYIINLSEKDSNSVFAFASSFLYLAEILIQRCIFKIMMSHFSVI